MVPSQTRPAESPSGYAPITAVETSVLRQPEAPRQGAHPHRNAREGAGERHDGVGALEPWRRQRIRVDQHEIAKSATPAAMRAVCRTRNSTDSCWRAGASQ